MREELPASAATVWSLIRDFGDLSAWAPEASVTSVEGDGVGAVRRVSASTGVFLERCEAHDENARRFSYRLLESPVPFQNYVAVVSLHEIDARRCVIEWSSQFETTQMTEERAVAMVGSAYRDVFVANIRRRLAAPSG